MPAALTEALSGEQTFPPPGSQAFFRLLILHCLFLGRLPTCGNTEDPSLYPSQAAGFQDSKLQGPGVSGTCTGPTGKGCHCVRTYSGLTHKGPHGRAQGHGV